MEIFYANITDGDHQEHCQSLSLHSIMFRESSTEAITLLIIGGLFTTSLLQYINPLSPHDALKHHFTSPKTDLIFLQPRGFRTKFSMKLVYQYMAIFFNF